MKFYGDRPWSVSWEYIDVRTDEEKARDMKTGYQPQWCLRLGQETSNLWEPSQEIYIDADELEGLLAQIAALPNPQKE